MKPRWHVSVVAGRPISGPVGPRTPDCEKDAMRNLLVPVIDATLTALKTSGAIKLDVKPSYVVEPPKNAAHGDLSCNVAMVMAKAEGQPPRKLAELIAARIAEGDTKGIVDKVEDAGPGFSN